MLIPEAVPVPVKFTVCGLPVALSVMVRLAVRLPVAVGAKVTLIAQLAPAATELPQVVVSAKSPLLAPVIAILVTLNDTAPVLVNVTMRAALVVPTPWLPKLTLVGERLIAGVAPVPVRLTVCGLPLALSETVTLAVLVPTANGVKVTVMVQLVPAAREVGQVLVWA